MCLWKFAKQEVPARQGENKTQQSSVENTVRKVLEMSQGAFLRYWRRVHTYASLDCLQLNRTLVNKTISTPRNTHIHTHTQVFFVSGAAAATAASLT